MNEYSLIYAPEIVTGGMYGVHEHKWILKVFTEPEGELIVTIYLN